jgi:glutamate:GABA antiporter
VKHQGETSQRELSVFVLAMLSLAVVISLRNLPLTAEYGLSALFFYVIAAFLFLIPYALVSAELASGWPRAGGVFAWVKAALGEKWGFFAIWMQWFHNMTWYPAMLAFIGAGIAYVINPALASNKIYLLIVILGGFWGVTLMNFYGIRTSALFSTACVIIGAILPGIILITMAVGWLLDGNPSEISFDYKLIIPDLTDIFQLVFLSGLFLALSGLEANANLAKEVKDPQKNYPRAILIASLLTLFILIAGSLAIAIVIPHHQINLVSGLLDAFQVFFHRYGMDWGVPIIAIFAVVGALGELNAWAIAGAKGLFTTTEYGCLPPILHKVNSRHVPVNLLIFQASLVSIFAFIFLYLSDVNVSYWILNAFAAQMYLVMYILLLISGIVLKYKKPNVHRPYEVPFGKKGMWCVVIIGCISSLFALMISFVPPTFWFYVDDVVIYEIIIVLGFIVSCALPLIIYSLRKPHWKLEVLEEIREDIHKNMHQE